MIKQYGVAVVRKYENYFQLNLQIVYAENLVLMNSDLSTSVIFLLYSYFHAIKDL